MLSLKSTSSVPVLKWFVFWSNVEVGSMYPWRSKSADATHQEVDFATRKIQCWKSLKCFFEIIFTNMSYVYPFEKLWHEYSQSWSHTSTTNFLAFRHLERFGVAFPDILWLWFHQAGKWLRRGHVAWPSLGTPRPYRGPGSCLALHSGEIVEFWSVFLKVYNSKTHYDEKALRNAPSESMEIEWDVCWTHVTNNHRIHRFSSVDWSGPRRLRWWCECRAVRSFTAFGWMVPWLSNCGRGRWVWHSDILVDNVWFLRFWDLQDLFHVCSTSSHL